MESDAQRGQSGNSYHGTQNHMPELLSKIKIPKEEQKDKGWSSNREGQSRLECAGCNASVFLRVVSVFESCFQK